MERFPFYYCVKHALTELERDGSVDMIWHDREFGYRIQASFRHRLCLEVWSLRAGREASEVWACTEALDARVVCRRIWRLRDRALGGGDDDRCARVY